VCFRAVIVMEWSTKRLMYMDSSVVHGLDDVDIIDYSRHWILAHDVAADVTA
jgi:hypothetical protein